MLLLERRHLCDVCLASFVASLTFTVSGWHVRWRQLRTLLTGCLFYTVEAHSSRFASFHAVFSLLSTSSSSFSEEQLNGDGIHSGDSQTTCFYTGVELQFSNENSRAGEIAKAWGFWRRIHTVMIVIPRICARVVHYQLLLQLLSISNVCSNYFNFLHGSSKSTTLEHAPLSSMFIQ